MKFRMTIEDMNSVDAIGIDKTTGKVVLTISDHLPWIEADRHIETLETKIESYLRFIEDESLVSNYPEASGRLIEIQLVCKHEPSESARSFLDAAGDQLRSMGLGFTCLVLHGAN